MIIFESQPAAVAHQDVGWIKLSDLIDEEVFEDL